MASVMLDGLFFSVADEVMESLGLRQGQTIDHVMARKVIEGNLLETQKKLAVKVAEEIVSGTSGFVPEYCKYDEESNKIVLIDGGKLQYNSCPEEDRADKEGVQYGVIEDGYILCPSAPSSSQWLRLEVCAFDRRYNGRAHCQNCKDAESATIVEGMLICMAAVMAVCGISFLFSFF